MSALLVFPGMSSPWHADYRPVYELLERQAKLRGCATFQLISYPGQCQGMGECAKRFSHKASLDTARKAIEEWLRIGKPFHVLGLSYGCNILLELLASLPQTQGLQSATLWGPFPYWKVWANFAEESEWPSALKGTKARGTPRQFFESIRPNEALIPRCRHRLRIGVGSLDKYVSRHDLDYLSSVCAAGEASPHVFQYLPGCSHNVKETDPGNDGYFSFVFGEFEKQAVR